MDGDDGERCGRGGVLLEELGESRKLKLDLERWDGRGVGSELTLFTGLGFEVVTLRTSIVGLGFVGFVGLVGSVEGGGEAADGAGRPGAIRTDRRETAVLETSAAVRCDVDASEVTGRRENMAALAEQEAEGRGQLRPSSAAAPGDVGDGAHMSGTDRRTNGPDNDLSLGDEVLLQPRMLTVCEVDVGTEVSSTQTSSSSHSAVNVTLPQLYKRFLKLEDRSHVNSIS